MYTYISIHTYILEQGRRLGWYRWPHVSQPSVDTVRCASPGLLGAHCSLALPRVTFKRLSLWARPRFSEKSGEKGPWLMVPYGPRSDEKWSRIHIYKRVMVPWVVRNGPNIYLNVHTVHRFIDPVDPSRSISTVDKDLPTGKYGRYRRSTRIYLWIIMVDVGLTSEIIVVHFIDTCGTRV